MPPTRCDPRLPTHYARGERSNRIKAVKGLNKKSGPRLGGTKRFEVGTGKAGPSKSDALGPASSTLNSAPLNVAWRPGFAGPYEQGHRRRPVPGSGHFSTALLR